MRLFLVWLLLLLPGLASAQGVVPLLNRQHPLAQGLVLMLYGAPGFAGGTRYYDLARGHHGTLSGFVSPAWGPIPTLPGVRTTTHDGVNAQVLVASTPALQPPKLTWLTLVKSTSSSQPIFAALLGKAGSYDLTANPTGGDSTQAACYVDNADGPQAVTPTGALPLQTWVWAGCTFDPARGSDQLRAFINGQRRAQASSALAVPYAGGTLFLGGAGGNAFTGSLGPVFVWNYALSDGQMADVYALAQTRFAGLLQLPSPLVGLATALGGRGSLFPFFQQ